MGKWPARDMNLVSGHQFSGADYFAFATAAVDSGPDCSIPHLTGSFSKACLFICLFFIL